MHADPTTCGRRSWTAWPTWRWPSCGPRSEAGAGAVQLFDSWAGSLSPSRVRALRPAGHPPGARRGWRTSACRPSSSASAPASCWASWRRPGPTSSGSTGGSPSTRPAGAWVPDRAVQGNLDPADLPRPVGGGGGRDPRRARAGPVTAPATSSTWATASCPRPTPASSAAVVELVHAEGRAGRGAVGEAWAGRGAGHGPRDARHSRGDRGLLHPHPPGPARPRPSSWPTCGAATRPSAGVSPLAARTAAQVAGLAARLEAERPGRLRRRLRRQAHRPAPSRRRRPVWPPRGVRAWWGWCSPRTGSSMGSGEYLARAARALAAVDGGADRSPRSSSGGRRRGSPTSWPAGCATLSRTCRAAHGDRSSCSPPTRCPERVVAEGDPYPDQVSASAAAVAAAAGLDGRAVPWQVAWQSAGRTPEPWLGPDVLSVIAGLAGPRARRCGALPPRFRLGPPRGPLRPRRRGPGGGREGGPRLRPHGLAQRRPGLPLGPGRRGDGGGRRMADAPVPAGPGRPTVAVVGGGIAGLAAAWELSGGGGGPDASTPRWW